MNIGNDEFTDVLETWLLEGSSEEDPNRIMDRALTRVDGTAQSRFPWLPRALAFTDSTIRVAMAAMVVALVSLAGAALVTSGLRPGGPGPEASPPASQASPESSVPAATNILGLPPVGATPSDRSPGQLVLRFDSSSIARADTIWVYADGRIISAPFQSTPTGMGDTYTGLVEQRLTPDGVAYLVSRVEATRLFESDLELAKEGGEGYFQLALRKGGEFVRVTWGHWITDAPAATAGQQAAMQSITDLFDDQSSWPASVWADDTLAAYVPSEYAVCFGVRPDGAGPGEWAGPVDPAVVHALLPAPAQEILDAGEPTTEHDAMHADAGCVLLTTDDARALAQRFAGSAVQRSLPASRFFVAYEYLDPTPAWDSIWIQFGPVMPHGAAIWIGPG